MAMMMAPPAVAMAMAMAKMTTNMKMIGRE
jgi:hypothetical protein